MARIDTHRASYIKTPNIRLGKGKVTHKITKKGLRANIGRIIDQLDNYADSHVMNDAEKNAFLAIVSKLSSARSYCTVLPE